MKLKSFSVKNYRSLASAEIKNITNFCAIVGPNNSGKSNLLRALVTALSIAENSEYKSARKKAQYSFIYQGDDYDWFRDIPRHLKDKGRSTTEFKLIFEFTEKEKKEFYEKFQVNLSKPLTMKFQLYKNETQYSIVVPGKAKKLMEDQLYQIGFFIREKLDYQYIPCLRTTDLTSVYFQQVIEREFESLSNNPEYMSHLERIREIQEPLLINLEQKMLSMLKTFLPTITNVKIPIEIVGKSPARLNPIRRLQIQINDGTETSLEEKGDGVKSLVAIGLMESISAENAKEKDLVLCIEEPESHLHPDAIHSLNNIIAEISKRTNVQVIITTHSPLLVDKNCPSNNYLVESNHRIMRCESISQIRELLGVRISDNLVGARRVLLVEGESDKRILKKLLSEKYAKFNDMITNKEIDIVNVRSASKMDYQIRLYDSILVPSIVVLDNDESGLQAYNNLINAKTKSVGEVFLIKSMSMQSNEIEDIINPDFYIPEIKRIYSVDLDTRSFRNRKVKWSIRIRTEVDKTPIQCDSALIDNFKTTIADIVEEKGLQVINAFDMQIVNNVLDGVGRFIGLRT